MISDIPQVLALQSLEAPGEQRRARQHHHRQRDLRRNERLPNAAPATRLRAGARIKAQRRQESGAGTEQGRHDAE